LATTGRFQESPRMVATCVRRLSSVDCKAFWSPAMPLEVDSVPVDESQPPNRASERQAQAKIGTRIFMGKT
jgi:hypothetical protein